MSVCATSRISGSRRGGLGTVPKLVMSAKTRWILPELRVGTRGATHEVMSPFVCVRNALLASGVVALALGCSTSSGPTTSSIVIGISGEDLRTAFEQVKITAKVSGQVAKEQTIVRDNNGVLPFPSEVLVEGATGAPVEVNVVASGTRSGPLTRLATTTMPPEKRLLRINLDSTCGGFGGPPVPCDANAGLTCQGGRCVEAAVAEQALEPYDKDWPVNTPDVCRPPNAGPPEVILGKGQTDFGTLAPNETVRLERGPQGGHHLWVAVRMKNLKQAGSRTAIFGEQPDTGLKASPTAFVFTFDKDEGGYCKLYGLRFQVDAGGALGEAHKPFLGKPLDITVEVTDVSGRKASAKQRVLIADKLLCPDGTENCNL